MTDVPAQPTRARSIFQTVGALAVAVLSALAWFGWLGWDNEYQADGSGPYQAWQVAGCALTLIVIMFGAVQLGVLPLSAAAAMTLAFTAAFSVTASQDTTGLWAVGALLIFISLASASVLVGFLSLHVRHRRLRGRTR
ncbi:hypothetical protein [Actinoplanes sp. NPDC049802]|uniref:hypothetical protein n=1 Tax=Actinoplanes sp. NPDC049802 TaxID=3154742 RepID=UPI0033CEB278